MIYFLKTGINHAKGSDRLKEKLLRILKILTAVLAVASALLLILSAAGVYITRGVLGSGTEDVFTREVIAESFGAIAPVIWAFIACAAVTGIFSLFCTEKKTFPKPHKVDNAAPEGKAVTAVRCAVLALAAVLIVLGVANGGMKDVLIKAIKICTECVGLG